MNTLRLSFWYLDTHWRKSPCCWTTTLRVLFTSPRLLKTCVPATLVTVIQSLRTYNRHCDLLFMVLNRELQSYSDDWSTLRLPKCYVFWYTHYSIFTYSYISHYWLFGTLMECTSWSTLTGCTIFTLHKLEDTDGMHTFAQIILLYPFYIGTNVGTENGTSGKNKICSSTPPPPRSRTLIIYIDLFIDIKWLTTIIFVPLL